MQGPSCQQNLWKQAGQRRFPHQLGRERPSSKRERESAGHTAVPPARMWVHGGWAGVRGDCRHVAAWCA